MLEAQGSCHKQRMQFLASNQTGGSFLFDPNMISIKLQQLLPKGFVLRPLNVDDFDRGNCCVVFFKTASNSLGFSKTLGQLSVTEGLTSDKFKGNTVG
jgi:hypothetical protein